LRLTISARGFYRSAQGSGISQAVRKDWERVLIHQTRVSEAAENCNETDIVSLLRAALTGLPLG
jgi:hypothetical protein